MTLTLPNGDVLDGRLDLIEIEPADGFKRFMPGARHYTLNGQPIAEADAEALRATLST